MGIIDKISLDLSYKLGERLDKSEDEKAVLNYGLFIMIHTSLAIVATFIAGIVTGLTLEIMIISMTSSWLKRYSGGIHASTPERCVIIGVILGLILSNICKYLARELNISSLLIVIITTLLIVYLIIYKKCPVPSKNKPLKKEITRKKLRKKSFNLVNILSVFIVVTYYIYISTKMIVLKTLIISILLGLALQVLALTKIGGKFINLLDNMFNIIKVKEYLIEKS
jgi:accessory gene regulator B